MTLTPLQQCRVLADLDGIRHAACVKLRESRGMGHEVFEGLYIPPPRAGVYLLRDTFGMLLVMRLAAVAMKLTGSVNALCQLPRTMEMSMIGTGLSTPLCRRL